MITEGEAHTWMSVALVALNVIQTIALAYVARCLPGRQGRDK